MTSSSGAIKSQNVDYSHFVSLPLPLPDGLVTKLNNFQNSVLGTTEDLGIEKSMFIKPQSFHLTVLMLKLWNNDRIEAAAEVLRSVSPKVIDALERQPVSIRLKGLACMRGSPEKAYVVYAPVEVIGGEARLLRACQVIINAFAEAGLVLEKDANQKLKQFIHHKKGSKSAPRVLIYGTKAWKFKWRRVERWAHYPPSFEPCVTGPR